jgi:hypothetical protein
MLTITGMVFKASDDSGFTEFVAQSRLSSWLFSNLNWAPPTAISVPALSAKERMKLDECMPINRSIFTTDTATHLQSHLGFLPGASLDELANYARYYRTFPHFSKVIL